MCDTYCKKRAAEQRTYPSKKTKVSQIDEQATSSSGPNVPDGNERLQPCAGLEDALINAVPTPIQYCRNGDVFCRKICWYLTCYLQVIWCVFPLCQHKNVFLQIN